MERCEARMHHSDPEAPEYHAYCEEYQHCLELIEREEPPPRAVKVTLPKKARKLLNKIFNEDNINGKNTTNNCIN
tara:strand:- start:439 stop:663 length:225 start_codon:yes stop_codon:yes gene_type:complete